MLNFFGIEFIEKLNDFQRNEKNYIDRFLFLQRSSHNYLRITRILKCLGNYNIIINRKCWFGTFKI
jgi:hypothetical protein